MNADNIDKKRDFTQEEKDEWIRKYNDWVHTFYPVDEFEIEDDDRRKIKFHRWNPIAFDEKEKEHLIYFADEENTLKDERKIIATIWVFLDRKQFNFIVDDGIGNIDFDGKRIKYGSTIYKNVQKILETLGIEDRQDYYVTVAHQSDHSFLQHMRRKELLENVETVQNEEKARDILNKFANFPYELDLKDINNIIECAQKVGIAPEEISKALNANGLLIQTKSLEEGELERFRKFEIPELQVSKLHKMIMETCDFKPILLIKDPNQEELTLEFRKVFEQLKEDAETGRKRNADISEYGEIIYMILNWKNVPLMIQNLNPEVQQYIKKLSISSLDYFRENGVGRNIENDYKTMKVVDTLAKSMPPLNKDDYINIYLKMLNCNHTLSDFKKVARNRKWFDKGIEQEACFEISQEDYYPYPKYDWKRNLDKYVNEKYKKKSISTKKLSKKGQKKIREIIKSEILKDGTANRKRIRTDMAGKTKDGKIIQVDNLNDWLFGVPGAFGNLYVSVDGSEILLPPQTPTEVVNLIENIVKNKAQDFPGNGEGR